MDAVAEFMLATEAAERRKRFEQRFEHFRQIRIDDGPAPSNAEDIHLRHLFEDAYRPSDYIDLVFKKAVTTAENYDLPQPNIPSTDILNIKKGALAGMEESFFLRLIYLHTLARNAENAIDEQIAIPKAQVLPDLKLVTAHKVFEALRVQGSLLLTNEEDETPPKKPSSLPPLLKGTYKAAAQNPLEVGFVMDVRTPAMINGKHIKIATVALQEPDSSRTTPTEIIIDGPLKDDIKLGDLIGVKRLQRVEGTRDLMRPEQAAMLVPVHVSSFLRQAEPDFSHIPSRIRELLLVNKDPDEILDAQDSTQKIKKGETLTDEHTGSMIFARVMDWDDRKRTITIKGHDNQTQTLRVNEPIDNFKLEQNMMFLTTPIKLGDDGIYTISSKKIFRVEAPYAGRLLLGLQKQSPSFLAESGFAPTEPALV